MAAKMTPKLSLEHYLLARLLASPRLHSAVTAYKLDLLVRNLEFVWYTDYQSNRAPLFVFSVQVCVTCNSVRRHVSSSLGTMVCEQCAQDLNEAKPSTNTMHYATGLTYDTLHIPGYVMRAVDSILFEQSLLSEIPQ